MGYLVKVRDYWRHTIGWPKDLSLETRIFHTYMLLAILALVFIIPFKLYIGLSSVVGLYVLLCLVLAAAFYFSRFKKKSKTSIIITALVVNILSALSYFFNGGIDGSEILLILFSLVCIIIIVPPRQYWLWTIVNVCCFLVPLVVSHFYPRLHVVTYQSHRIKVADMVFTYLSLVCLIRLTIPYIIRNYNYARILVEHKAEAMDTLNQEKNKLISIISHDIRAPLIHIQSYLELMLENEFDLEESQAIKNNLLQSTRDTLDMMTNLLTWSKNQMDGQKISFEKIDMGDMLLSGQQLYKNIAAHKNITLDYHIDSQIVVRANRDMLTLVLRNLINNAIKFTSPGGKISVIASCHTDGCILEIKDSGNGKPAVLSNDLFKFSAKSTYGTNKEKGVGLGLVLCKEYTEAQGGEIWFETSPVSGVSFFVKLPMVKGINTAAVLVG